MACETQSMTPRLWSARSTQYQPAVCGLPGTKIESRRFIQIPMLPPNAAVRETPFQFQPKIAGGSKDRIPVHLNNSEQFWLGVSPTQANIVLSPNADGSNSMPTHSCQTSFDSGIRSKSLGASVAQQSRRTRLLLRRGEGYGKVTMSSACACISLAF